MRARIGVFIALAFLGYGLLRLGVGSVLLGQQIGLFDVAEFREAMAEIAKFLAKSNGKQIIPVSVGGYVACIALMGFVLSSGAVAALMRKTVGLPLIGAFLAMYALLFVNFQTINPKAIHLGVCVLLFVALLWSRRDPSKLVKRGSEIA